MLEITGDIYLLGDPHGVFAPTLHTIKQKKIKNSTILCVGDVGVGYPNYNATWLEKLAESFRKAGNHFYAIRGNHDNPAYFNGATYGNAITLLKDYTYFKVNGETWLVVGGATSVDRCANIQGISYFAGEEFELKEELVKQVDVLVTHTGPDWIGPNDLNPFVEYWVKREGWHLWDELKKERMKLDRLYELANPKRAYLGHFHTKAIEERGDCTARILTINEMIKDLK